MRDALDREARGTSLCEWCGEETSQGAAHAGDCPVTVFEDLVEQLETLQRELERTCALEESYTGERSPSRDALNPAISPHRDLTLTAALDALRFHGFGGGLCRCGLCKELPVPDDLDTSNQEREP